jgi:hypothetical protein
MDAASLKFMTRSSICKHNVPGISIREVKAYSVQQQQCCGSAYLGDRDNKSSNKKVL